MSREIIGDVCAFIKMPEGQKNRYLKVGMAMKDGDRLSLKIDTLPLPGSGWDGWINIFPTESSPRPHAAPTKGSRFDMDDDIPF